MRTPVADSSNAHPPTLSATQVVASALAAVSASIAASILGVAGTVVGAALASGLSTAGTALYDYALRRTRNKLPAAPPRWSRVAITAVLVFALAISAITLGELASGRSAANTVHGAAGPSAPAIAQLVEPRQRSAHTRAVDQTPTPANPSTVTADPAAPVSTPATPTVPTPTASLPARRAGAVPMHAPRLHPAALAAVPAGPSAPATPAAGG